MRYQIRFWLCFACSLSVIAACSNNANTTLNTADIEQMLVVDKSSILFSSQRNAPAPANQFISARFYGDQLLVQPLGEVPPWLAMEVTENPKQKLTLLQFTIKNTQLSAGEYKSKVRLVVYRERAFGRKPVGYKDLEVVFQVTDDFNISEKNLEFYSVYGGAGVMRKTLHLYGSGSHWRASTSKAWLNISRKEGSGSSDIHVTVIRDHPALKAGQQTADVVFSDRFRGRQVAIPVTLQLEPPRLFVSDHGVAFTQLYHRRKVAHTIQVSGNTAGQPTWYAVSNRRWLKLKQSNDGTTLQLTAVPKRLSRGLHYASVEIHGQAPARNVETIQVAFYINGGVKAPKPTIALKQWQPQGDMVTDPIRPYVYVTTPTDVHRYNIYTGEKQVMANLDKSLTALAIADDGRYLYLADRSDFSIKVFDLREQMVHARWPGPLFATDGKNPRLHLAFTRSNGKPIILNNSFNAFDAQSGDLLYRFNAQTKPGQMCCTENLPDIVPSRGGNSFYLQERGEHGHALFRFQMQYSYIKGVGLKIRQTGYMSSSGAALDLAVSADGDEACIVTTGEHLSRCYFGPSVAPSRLLRLSGQPNNIEFGRNGDIFAAFKAKRKPGIWHFNAISGKRGKRYTLKDVAHDRRMMLSGDNLSIVTMSKKNQSLSFVSTR